MWGSVRSCGSCGFKGWFRGFCNCVILLLNFVILAVDGDVERAVLKIFRKNKKGVLTSVYEYDILVCGKGWSYVTERRFWEGMA